MRRVVVLLLLAILLTIGTASAQTVTFNGVTWYQNGVKVTKISVGYPAKAVVHVTVSGLTSGESITFNVQVREDVPWWFDKDVADYTYTVSKNGVYDLNAPFTIPSSDSGNRGVFIKVTADVYEGGQLVKHITVYDNTDPNQRFAEGTEVALTTSPPPSATPTPTPTPTPPPYHPPSYQPTPPPSYRPPSTAYGYLVSAKWYQNGKMVKEVVAGRGAVVYVTLNTYNIRSVDVQVRVDYAGWFDKEIAHLTMPVSNGRHTFAVSFTVPTSVFEGGGSVRGVFVKVTGTSVDGRTVKIYDVTDPSQRFAEGTEVRVVRALPIPTPAPMPTPTPPPYHPPSYQPTPPPSYRPPSAQPTQTPPATTQPSLNQFELILIAQTTTIVAIIAIALILRKK